MKGQDGVSMWPNGSHGLHLRSMVQMGAGKWTARPVPGCLVQATDCMHVAVRDRVGFQARRVHARVGKEKVCVWGGGLLRHAAQVCDNAACLWVVLCASARVWARIRKRVDDGARDGCQSRGQGRPILRRAESSGASARVRGRPCPRTCMCGHTWMCA